MPTSLQAGCGRAEGRPGKSAYRSRSTLNNKLIRKLKLRLAQRRSMGSPWRSSPPPAPPRTEPQRGVSAEGGSGSPEKVFNELWKPSRGRLGARRDCKVLDDHKAVDLSLQVGV